MNTSGNDSVHPFTLTTVFICGGLLIWAADFLLVYGIAAVACAKGFAMNTIAGVPFVAFVATSITAGGILATVFLLRTAIRKLRAHTQEANRFIYTLTASIAGMAVLAMFFNVLPAWLLAGEC
jgi:hypothetical protein